MHKNSQAPQCILRGGRLEFTAAGRLLHLHVLQASPSQYIPNQMNYPSTLFLLQPSIWVNTIANLPGTKCRNIGSFLFYHVTPMSICDCLAEIHTRAVRSILCTLFLDFHFPGEGLFPSTQAQEKSACSLPRVLQPAELSISLEQTKAFLVLRDWHKGCTSSP